MLLKIGSKGDDVKQLLKWLGLTADGDFGKKTEEAVKKFQKENNLTVDGIVGNTTWNLLKEKNTTVSTNTKVVDPSVVYNPLSVHITKAARTVKYIAIHFTAGSSSKAGKANSNKNVFINRKASADFAVDDETMVLFNPDITNYYCWSVGDTTNKSDGGGTLKNIAVNKNTVNIEICSSIKSGYNVSYSNHEGWYFTEAAIDNAVKLTKILMKKYNIPLDHVVRHYDITGKLCPGLVGWNDGNIYTNKGKRTTQKNYSTEWTKFKERLS